MSTDLSYRESTAWQQNERLGRIDGGEPSRRDRTVTFVRTISPAWVAVVVSMLLGLAQLTFFPHAGTDYAAQAARSHVAGLAPLNPVDFSWYGGVQAFNYSLLAPIVMAFAGVALTGFITSLGSSVLFARLISSRPRAVPAASVAAGFFVADVASGRITFSLGMTAGLACLACSRHRFANSVLALLTALLSPVAALLLGLAAASMVLTRDGRGWLVGLCAALPVLALGTLFPGVGSQPFGLLDAWPALGVTLAVFVLCDNMLIRKGAVLYGAAILLLVAVPSPVGSNILRLPLLFAASILIAFVRVGVRRSALFVAVLAALSWQLGPVMGDLTAARAPSYALVTAELVHLHSRRVEVVALRDHGEASTVAEAVPLVRGWSRQSDFNTNSLLYKSSLTSTAYVAWLRSRGVDHVAYPKRGPYDYGSAAEAGLLARGAISGLKQVWTDADWVVYDVDSSAPLISAPGSITSQLPAGWALSAPTAGVYVVLIHWFRWLSLDGPGCIEQDGGVTAIHMRIGGLVRLSSSLLPRGHCLARTVYSGTQQARSIAK